MNDYTVQTLRNGEWIFWDGSLTIKEARKTAKYLGNRGYSVRIWNVADNEEVE